MTQASKIQAFAYYSFLPIILGFLFYVGLGYYIMISSQWPTWSGAVVILLCLAIVALIYFFVRHTGFAIYEASVATGWRRLVWIPLFLILFVFSGYGFLTSSMLLIEGPDIAREEIAALSANLGKLQTAASDLTRSATYDEFAGALDVQRKALMREIENPTPGFCGIGPQANIILSNIEDIGRKYSLPFTRPSDMQKKFSCTDKNSINRYKDGYNELLGNMDKGLRQRLGLIENKIKQDEIINQIKPDIEVLKDKEKALVGVHYFFDLGFYHEILAATSRAYGDYTRAAQNLPGFAAGSLDTGDLEHLGLFLYLPGLLWARLLVMPTILLCMLALICDAAASLLVAAVLQRQRRLQDEQRLSAAVRRVGGKDVTYLWIPETHPLAPTGGTRR